MLGSRIVFIWMILQGGGSKDCETLKELTCEIECHLGANGYPGVEVFHWAGIFDEAGHF